jgi:uncharacterized iron-regulated membrane protein
MAVGPYIHMTSLTFLRPHGLASVSDIATVLTAMIAAGFWGRYQWERRRKRLRLERHLRDYTHPRDGRGCTLPELVANLGMSEQDILDAAFRSRS